MSRRREAAELARVLALSTQQTRDITDKSPTTLSSGRTGTTQDSKEMELRLMNTPLGITPPSDDLALFSSREADPASRIHNSTFSAEGRTEPLEASHLDNMGRPSGPPSPAIEPPLWSTTSSPPGFKNPAQSTISSSLRRVLTPTQTSAPKPTLMHNRNQADASGSRRRPALHEQDPNSAFPLSSSPPVELIDHSKQDEIEVIPISSDHEEIEAIEHRDSVKTPSMSKSRSALYPEIVIPVTAKSGASARRESPDPLDLLSNRERGSSTTTSHLLAQSQASLGESGEGRKSKRVKEHEEKKEREKEERRRLRRERKEREEAEKQQKKIEGPKRAVGKRTTSPRPSRRVDRDDALATQAVVATDDSAEVSGANTRPHQDDGPPRKRVRKVDANRDQIEIEIDGISQLDGNVQSIYTASGSQPPDAEVREDLESSAPPRSADGTATKCLSNGVNEREDALDQDSPSLIRDEEPPQSTSGPVVTESSPVGSATPYPMLPKAVAVIPTALSSVSRHSPGPLNASGSTIRPGGIKWQTPRNDLSGVLAKFGGSKTTGMSRRHRIAPLHAKIGPPAKALPPVPQKPIKKKKGEESEEDSDEAEGASENEEDNEKKRRAKAMEWYMMED